MSEEHGGLRPVDHYGEALVALAKRDHWVAIAHAILSLGQTPVDYADITSPDVNPDATIHRGDIESFGRS